jgi:multiple sugar transport system ATP-binding protein
VVPPGKTAPALRVVPLGVEALGDEKHLLFDAPHSGADDGADPAHGDVPITVDEAAVSQLWTAKVAQHADVAIGRPAALSLDLREAYFFDPRTGAAISAADTGAAAPAAVAVGS